ncbi:MAG: acyl-CoA thioesterase [Pikeienuella sp.]|uniref:acyl-CoA thioesterase n=1 Tax=Pikeienuella sp. TaxID=2831957 RepID=UPI003919CD77
MPQSGPRPGAALQTIAMPADTNANGDIFGGWLMGQMDLGASVLARGLAEGRVATVAVESMLFHHPVRVGDVVSIFPSVATLGRTSMTLDVEVRIFNAESGAERRVAECRIVFVAIDRDGRPRPLPGREAAQG